MRFMLGRALFTLTLVLAAPCAVQAAEAEATQTEEVKVPLRSGTYFFEHRYAETPNLRSFLLMVTIKGNEISIVKPSSGGPFPQGEIARGTLFWHAASEQWIIVTSDEDRTATDVGGCSDGPEVVDLKRRIYWTC